MHFVERAREITTQAQDVVAGRLKYRKVAAVKKPGDHGFSSLGDLNYQPYERGKCPCPEHGAQGSEQLHFLKNGPPHSPEVLTR
jgi:hypothetical protein